uniref:Uncharacterized protein n=1 Tax=Arundo donax TaxID=35708 RepID=A0A0A9BPP4_ARUDO
MLWEYRLPELRECITVSSKALSSCIKPKREYRYKH